jgi:hypothetical protein
MALLAVPTAAPPCDVLPSALMRVSPAESTMSTLNFETERERWLDEIVGLPEAAYLRKVSVDTLKREARRGNVKIIELSARRRGITRREALKQTGA